MLLKQCYSDTYKDAFQRNSLSPFSSLFSCVHVCVHVNTCVCVVCVRVSAFLSMCVSALICLNPQKYSLANIHCLPCKQLYKHKQD